MPHYDVFNGDADGILALVQLRLAEPRDAELVTGVKRDIKLLERVTAGQGDSVTVLDISMDSNAAALRRVLDAGASVRYVDHHFPGEVPQDEHLDALIDTSADTCTALLVDGLLDGAYRKWAVAAAFGDNLRETALRVGGAAGYSVAELEALETLGICINYNGYGTALEDLHFHPADLYRAAVQFADPLQFIAEGDTYRQLKAGYDADMANVASLQPVHEGARTAAFLLPDAPWARRVSGVFGNDLANKHPSRAHAVVTELDDAYRISVRAPLDNKTGADDLCRSFPTGGGRAGAGGINALPKAQLDTFLAAFDAQW